MATSCHPWRTWWVTLGSWSPLDATFTWIPFSPGFWILCDLAHPPDRQWLWDAGRTGMSVTPLHCKPFSALAVESEQWLPATVALRRIHWGWKKEKRKEDEYMWLWHCADFHFLSYFYSFSHPGGTCCPFLAPVNVTHTQTHTQKWDCRVLTVFTYFFLFKTVGFSACLFCCTQTSVCSLLFSLECGAGFPSTINLASTMLSRCPAECTSTLALSWCAEIWFLHLSDESQGHQNINPAVLPSTAMLSVSPLIHYVAPDWLVRP